MADLHNERDDTLSVDDLVALHCRIKDRCKNTSSFAGVQEDLQQLVCGDGHTFLRM
jgi:hypothetical protein